MLEAGLIEPSKSDWASAIHLVLKSDGSLRVTVDYRKLNERIVGDAYPLPMVKVLFAHLSKGKFMSKFDCLNGYYQIRMKPGVKHLTAFACDQGLFEWNVMPMGLKTAGATFQRFMDRVFGDLIGKGIVVYLDDIFVYSSTLAEHVRLVAELARRLNAHKLHLKASKCEILRTKIEFLGHTISDGLIAPSPENVKPLLACKTPANARDVMSFLGMCNYYGDMIKDLKLIAGPLYDATSCKRKFEWTEACQASFENLKSILAGELVLALPDFDQPFILQTDACKQGIAAVLSQIVDGRERPVSFFSQRCNKAQQNYPACELELMAIHNAMLHYKFYLLGKHFTVATDHQPLKWLLSAKEPAPRLARWLITLNSFDFTVVYRKGSNNGNADALSRLVGEDADEAPEFDDTVINVIQTRADTTATEPPEPCRIDLAPFQRAINVTLFDDSRLIDQWQDEDLRWLQDLVVSGRDPALERNADLQPDRRRWLKLVPDLRVINGNVYLNTDDADEQRLVYLVPRQRVRSILKSMHAGVCSGHLGIDKTEARVRERFFWLSLRHDVRKFVRECPSCQKIKNTTPARIAPLQPIKSNDRDSITCADLAGPLKPTKKGNRFVRVIVNHLTGFVKFYASRDATHVTYAEALLEHCCTFGFPRAILTDRGSDFNSAVIKALYELVDIRQIRTSPFHPETDGKSENIVGVMKTMMIPYLNESQDNWDECLPQLAFAYNTAVHATTKFTPFELMYVRAKGAASDRHLLRRSDARSARRIGSRTRQPRRSQPT